MTESVLQANDEAQVEGGPPSGAEAASEENLFAGRRPAAIYNRILSGTPLVLMLEHGTMVDNSVIDASWWEDDIIQALRQQVKDYGKDRPKYFLDVGAYWGLYALLFAKTGGFKQIHAFESDPYNYAQLQANLFLNKAAYDVQAHNAVVSGRVADWSMLRSLDHPGGNRAGVGILGEATSADSSCVMRSVVLDHLFTDVSDSFVAMKIDVEGHELNVIEGMRGLVSRNDVLVQCETFDGMSDMTDALMAGMGMKRFNRMDNDSYFKNY